jgi:hypothetical protein
MGAIGAVEDLSNVDIRKPVMDAHHRLVIGVLVECQDKL